MNSTVEECQRMWQRLRERYSREKKIKPSGSAASVTASWVYFSSMSFLEKYIKPRRTFTATNIESSDDIAESSCSSMPWSSMSTILETPAQDISDNEVVEEVLEDEPDMVQSASTSQAARTEESVPATPKLTHISCPPVVKMPRNVEEPESSTLR